MSEAPHILRRDPLPDASRLRNDLLLTELTRSEHHLLLFLWFLWAESGGPPHVDASFTGIGESMRATRQSVAQWAQALEKKGLIRVSGHEIKPPRRLPGGLVEKLEGDRKPATKRFTLLSGVGSR